MTDYKTIPEYLKTLTPYELAIHRKDVLEALERERKILRNKKLVKDTMTGFYELVERFNNLRINVAQLEIKVKHPTIN